MKFEVYILYSATIEKYYVGYTSQTLTERLNYHLGNHKGFTSRAKDWKVVFAKVIDNKNEALKLEKKIKKRGVSRFLNDIQGD